MTVGNTYDSASHSYDVLIQVSNSSGDIEWETTYGRSGGLHDYGMAVVNDQDDNIYVGATSYSTTHTEGDFLVIAYDKNGILLWVDSLDQGNDDICADIAINEDEDALYVFGSTYNGDNEDYDYLLAAYDSESEELSWTETYNREGYDDIGMLIGVDESGNIVVSGGSGTTTSDWEIATLIYDNNGTLDEENITSSNGAGFDQPNELLRSDDGFIYLTGASAQSTGGYFFYTTKLDSNLNTVWVDSVGTTGTDNRGLSMAEDISGNIYVSGYTDVSGQKEFTVISYTSGGTLRWEQTFFPGQSDISLAKKIRWHPWGFLVVAGEKFEGVERTIELVGLDSTGNKKWESHVPVAGAIDSSNLDILINNQGDFMISGVIDSLLNPRYKALNCEVYDQEYTFTTDSSGNPLYAADEVLIRFPPAVVNQSFVNNSKLSYGTVADVILDTTIIDTLDDIFDANGELEDWTLMKIYRRLKTTDTVSVTRLGDSIRIPAFWSSMILKIPPSTSRSVIDPLTVAAELDSLPVDMVIHASPNLIFNISNVPNDAEYTAGNQKSLFNSNTPMNGMARSHVNAEAAWSTLHTLNKPKGSSNVRVGVIDSGINGGHEDLKFSTTLPGFSGSVVDNGGFDYLLSPGGTSISNVNTDIEGHGTAMGGIIAALRNNSIGVAGIAGGDIGVSQTEGVHLIPMRAFDSQGLGLMSNISAATVDAAVGASGSALFEIMNNSFGIFEGSPDFNTVSIAEYRNAMRHAFQAGMIIVNSRGQKTLQSGDESMVVPASMSAGLGISTKYYDGWGICVGATDDDAIRQDNVGAWSSLYGRDLDIMSPGVEDMIFSLGFPGTTTYSSLKGTSPAAAHVSGAAALLQSYHSLPLCSEDVEKIIEYAALDITQGVGTVGTGYDTETGWGLLDLDECFDILTPFRRVKHFEIKPTPSTAVPTTPSLININLLYDYEMSNMTIPAGAWPATAKQYIVTATIPFSPGEQLASLPGSQVPVWVRNSGSNLFDSTPDIIGGTGDDLVPEHYIQLLGWGANSVTLFGYYYEVDLSAIGQGTVVIPEGADTDPVLAYSALVISPHGVGVSDESLTDIQFQLVPNPTEDVSVLEFALPQSDDLTIDLLDSHGRTLRGVYHGKMTAGSQKLEIDLSGLSSGMYLCKVTVGNSVEVLRIVKTQ